MSWTTQDQNMDEAGECENCAEHQATVNRWGTLVCSACNDSLNEAAYERSLSEYYGGTSAQTEGERNLAAHAAKKAGR